MDDLISRKQIMDEAKRLSGPITGDGWDNWGVYALIERQPSVSAVPLDKLCEWLSENSVNFPCTSCKNVLNDCCYCTADWDEGVPCPNSTDDWRRAITEWMEEQDAADRRE